MATTLLLPCTPSIEQRKEKKIEQKLHRTKLQNFIEQKLQTKTSPNFIEQNFIHRTKLHRTKTSSNFIEQNFIEQKLQTPANKLS